MAKNNNTERDRDVTEQRMLKAVGEMIRRDGFEKLGVNAVAAHCGVSKILIYRYFGSAPSRMRSAPPFPTRGPWSCGSFRPVPA